MPDLKLTTDMGDWSTLPKRIRLASVSFLVGASVVGLAAGIGVNPRWRSTLSLGTSAKSSSRSPRSVSVRSYWA